MIFGQFSTMRPKKVKFFNFESNDQMQLCMLFPNISNLFISEGGILKLLKGLDISKASGPDQIPNKVLRELAIHLAPVLTIT